METEEPNSEENVSAKKEKIKVYIPGRSRALAEDEELVMDKSAYRLYYQLQVEAPSLSFDVLHDWLGENRSVEVSGDPVSAYVVAGTQAVKNNQNNLIVMRLSNLKPLSVKTKDGERDDEDDDSESESDDEDLDNQPEVDAAKIVHNGTINRVRAHQFNGVYMAAAWSELGEVSIWNLSRPLNAVNDSAIMSEYLRNHESPSPLFTYKGHKDEGYGLAWSPCPSASGHLATGDCKGFIHIWQPRPTGWAVSTKPFVGHTDSVEDIQWSSTEPTVFLSCSADCSIRVWDTRSGSKSASMITVPDAHSSDVNVISWSNVNPVSLVSGGDDGLLRVWDLRMMQQRYGKGSLSSGATGLAPYTHYFDYHKSPITSVEWHPSETGVFVATSEDDQTTIWDITLEQDAEAVVAMDIGDTVQTEAEKIPVQLLFIHTGQHEVKDAHWHPQIPGLILNTALDGFNVFRTICI